MQTFCTVLSDGNVTEFVFGNSYPVTLHPQFPSQTYRDLVQLQVGDKIILHEGSKIIATGKVSAIPNT